MFNQKKELNYNKERKKIKGKFIKKNKKSQCLWKKQGGNLKMGTKFF